MRADTKKTLSETLLSLTGFDEIAIQRHMNVDIYDVINTKNVLSQRCLIFVDLTRESKTPGEALAQVQGMPVREVMAYFAPDPEEIDEDEPETSEGKELSPSDSEPENSPPSA